MDRRYVCQDCRTKWFVPAHRVHEPGPVSCAACGGRLLALAVPPPAAEREAPERR